MCKYIENLYCVYLLVLKVKDISNTGAKIRFIAYTLDVKNGFASRLCHISSQDESSANIIDSAKRGINVKINKVHEPTVHCGEDILKATSKALSWKIPGKVDTCKNCVIGKAKQKKTNKTWSQGSKTPGKSRNCYQLDKRIMF